ncbi:hypothetical protein H2204_001889 [Knufia peltigerae]|uniref:Uncharacterized protein n=1 Tax=Knufia peltigerae TaxID=1002370 RepID=A0AA38YCC6_9EURO|nr:hypothetical protein H2204_001889 [Knufia peltigerae]
MSSPRAMLLTIPRNPPKHPGYNPNVYIEPCKPFTMASLRRTMLASCNHAENCNQTVRIASGRNYAKLPVPVSRDDQAQCCTITKALLDKLSLHGVKPLPCQDDGHICNHHGQIRRVVLDVKVGEFTQLAFVAFCVLEGTESSIVMTGREECWVETPKLAGCHVVRNKRKSDEVAEQKRRNEEDEQHFASVESTEKAIARAKRAARRKAASGAANAQNAASAQDNQEGGGGDKGKATQQNKG